MHEHGLLAQLLHADRPGADQRVIRRSNEDQLILGEHGVVQCSVVSHTLGKTNVDATIQQLTLDGFGVFDSEREFDPRIGPRVAGERLRQHIGANRPAGPYGQPALTSVAQIIQGLFRLRANREQPLGVIQQYLPRPGEHHTTRSAIKQRHALTALELRQLAGHRRLRHAQLIGTCRHATGPRNRVKNRQVVEIHH